VHLRAGDIHTLQSRYSRSGHAVGAILRCGALSVGHVIPSRRHTAANACTTQHVRLRWVMRRTCTLHCALACSERGRRTYPHPHARDQHAAGRAPPRAARARAATRRRRRAMRGPPAGAASHRPPPGRAWGRTTRAAAERRGGDSGCRRGDDVPRRLARHAATHQNLQGRPPSHQSRSHQRRLRRSVCDRCITHGTRSVTRVQASPHPERKQRMGE
jgi:hypothetical protein